MAAFLFATAALALRRRRWVVVAWMVLVVGALNHPASARRDAPVGRREEVAHR